jgi:hypothetical protein
MKKYYLGFIEKLNKLAEIIIEVMMKGLKEV